ncbi:MAG: (2Fe-2S) ferredoxin domain-containing protein [Trichodesmium sp.]
MKKENLYLCMGSACHQLGVYEVLPKLQSMISEYDLEDKIELKGSFCLESCSDGIVMKYKNQVFLKINSDNIEQKFEDEILPIINSKSKGEKNVSDEILPSTDSKLQEEKNVSYE